jgi:hypothetical protein
VCVLCVSVVACCMLRVVCVACCVCCVLRVRVCVCCVAETTRRHHKTKTRKQP